MHIQHIILASGLVMIAGCQTIGGDSMPTLTRTGEVKDVMIGESVEPTSVTASPGDEIRWTNKRQGTVRVIFLKPMTDNLTCQRNFGGPWDLAQNATNTRPNSAPRRQQACVSGIPAR